MILTQNTRINHAVITQAHIVLQNLTKNAVKRPIVLNKIIVFDEGYLPLIDHKKLVITHDFYKSMAHKESLGLIHTTNTSDKLYQTSNDTTELILKLVHHTHT